MHCVDFASPHLLLLHCMLRETGQPRPRLRLQQRWCNQTGPEQREPYLKYFPLRRTPRMRGTIQAATTSASSARMLMILAARGSLSPPSSSSVATMPGLATCTEKSRFPFSSAFKLSCRPQRQFQSFPVPLFTR